jgi:hypothetical protein
MAVRAVPTLPPYDGRTVPQLGSEVFQIAKDNRQGSKPGLQDRLPPPRHGPAVRQRVLTTTDRNPPLRTDNVLGFRAELPRQSRRRGGLSAQHPLATCPLVPKRSHEQTRKRARAGRQGAVNWQKRLLAFNASTPPTLPKVFGWVWSVAVGTPLKD